MHEDRLTPRQAQQLALSALLDGDASQADRALAAWREEPAARADWHAYQIIGEAMRSDDVNCRAPHDVAFLARVRARLAKEPVVLAPAAVSTPRAERQASWRTAWAAPVAVAAGFIAVAGVLVVTRVAAPGGVAPEAASALAGGVGTAPALGGLQVVSSGGPLRSSTPGAPAASTMASGALIRSADLDLYLAAHRQYSATSSLSVPGGAARNVTVAAPPR